MTRNVPTKIKKPNRLTIGFQFVSRIFRLFLKFWMPQSFLLNPGSNCCIIWTLKSNKLGPLGPQESAAPTPKIKPTWQRIKRLSFHRSNGGKHAALIDAYRKKTASCLGGCHWLRQSHPSPQTSCRFFMEGNSSGKKTQKAKTAFFSNYLKHFLPKHPVVVKNAPG